MSNDRFDSFKDWNKMLENEWLGNQGEEGNSKYAYAL
jgi:hypothetical protein